jgi:hypothetical protein
MDLEVAKQIVTGGEIGLGLRQNPSRFQPGVFPLNPQNGSSLDLSLMQPLLQGGGYRANVVPIVLARIDTERSFFQLKDTVQELVLGEMRNGSDLSSRPGQFTDWTLGVNFSVPLGLRRERAALRRQELIIARDRANLQQGLHSASHILAENIRNLAQFYEQYDVFKETRAAASTNLDLQMVR